MTVKYISQVFKFSNGKYIFYIFFIYTYTMMLISSIDKKIGFVESKKIQKKITGVQPILITEKTRYDTDDPAIWINHEEPEKSLVLGTDKHRDGALYVFNLEGKIVWNKVVHHLLKPNNVDVGYDFKLDGKSIDIAVVTEMKAEKLRIFRLPDMAPVDKGGIRVFQGELSAEFRSPMGIGLYRRSLDGAMFAIVSRKKGPSENYLWQYLLEDDGEGGIKGTLVRKFGAFSGAKGIEAIAVDEALGYIYYSDEKTCIRKYHADPRKGSSELASFGSEDFAGDREGIAIYSTDPEKGYILVSDQHANRFNIYRREGEPDDPHRHQLLKSVPTAAVESDGCAVSHHGFGGRFPHGLFVAMSNDKTFHFYAWPDIIGDDLQPSGRNTTRTLAKGLR